MKENLKFEFLVSFLFRKDFKKDRKLPPAYTGRGCRVCNTPQSESMICDLFTQILASVKLILSSGLNHEEVGSITSLKGKEILREFEELNEKHSVPPIVLGVDQVKSVVLEMVMQSRKGLQLDDLHENNNKEFSNQSSEIYNASITNDYQEKMERENEK
ncbi:hypothetical protein SLEP1_g58742 [Rubroshorea leprosula]|uniref:Uncharacterized protein n=1 Tax=Rubroshorea leprosula TaxID=152421 RepID=A0AAV5MTW8_9ROSI|nr:hypothetical protein SLEP1_g58742 [Rubroshorea leprosula]